MEKVEVMPVEVAYALPDEQVILELEAPIGITAEEAIRQSGVLERYPEIDLDKNRIGVFGKLCKKDRVMQPNDRVEIYRPLIADPKEVRRQRAAEGKATKKGVREGVDSGQAGKS
jgi:putative ubiquitin-RnfH superfamily antitoxin RatB of RatAB toxin-antitoxin module